MNDAIPPLRQPIDPQGPPTKKGCGCLLNTLLGLAAFAIALIAAVWILLMHSPLPLRTVAGFIEEAGVASNLKLTGISGSLSSGLHFDKITWNDGEITDVRFRYSGILDVIRRKELIIHEMHIGSARIRSDFFSEAPDETPEDTSAESATQGQPIDPPLRLLQIDRLSLNQISLSIPASDRTITIPKLVWTGFRAEHGKPVQFGDIQADSDHLAIQTTTPANTLYQKRLQITLMPKLHPQIRKPLPIDALLGEKDNKPVFDIKAFEGTVTFTTGADGTQYVRAHGAHLSDYLDAPLPRELHLEATIAHPDTDHSTLTVQKGSFLLGTKTFEVQPTNATGPDDHPTGTVLLALCRSGTTDIRYEIPATGNKDNPNAFRPILRSTPTLKPDDLMALLYHDRPFSALPAADQEQLRRHASWFVLENQ